MPDGPNLFSALRRCGRYLRPNRGRLIAAGLAAATASAAGLALPLVLQQAIDGPLAGGDWAGLGGLVAVMAVLGVGEGLLVAARRLLVVRPATELETGMRADLLRRLHRLPMSFHERHSGGQLLSRAVGDITEIGRFVAFSAIYLVVNVFTLLVGLAVLVALSPRLALVVLVAFAPMVAVTVVCESRLRAAARSVQHLDGEVTTAVEESVLGARLIRSFGRGPAVSATFEALTRALRDNEVRRLHQMALMWAAIVALPELAIAGLLAIGTHGVVTGTLSVGTLVAAVTATTYLRWPADTLGWLIAEANIAAAAAERYWTIRDTPDSVPAPDPARSLPGAPRGELRFSGVHYRPEAHDAEVLHGVDLRLRPGETVALTGPTGAGKSTLTTLASRLADPSAGRVSLDGVDLRSLDEDVLRSTVVHVFDEPLLFDASVRDNACLGARRPLTDEEVWEALRVVRADDFVRALPGGLDAPIGERGNALSGGQRQRLALARALLAAPLVLVLDNPLSALDATTAREVETAWAAATADVTTLVVTDRPSSAARADRVALLSGGRVVACAPHVELLAAQPLYRSLMAEPRTMGVAF